MVIKSDETKDSAETIKNRNSRHAKHSQPNFMRRTADDEQSRDNSDCQSRSPCQGIEAPAASRSQRPIKPFLFYQAKRANGKFEVCWATPNSGDDSEDDPPLDVARIVHAVV